MALAAFVVVALLAVASALGLVLRKNPIHGALFLIVNLGCIAAFYLMLGAEFLAAAQVIVYAGAIMVLFVFAIMVLIPGKEETGPDPNRRWRILALPLAGTPRVLLFPVLAARTGGRPPPLSSPPPPPPRPPPPGLPGGGGGGPPPPGGGGGRPGGAPGG